MYTSIFLNWEPTPNKTKLNLMTLNFGPQHPAAHGVLRLVLQLKNEYIVKTDIHIGLLHRGTEYLIERKPYILNTGYFDRLDYVSMLAQEHAYCLALETNTNAYSVNLWNLHGRTLLDELTRILNHLLAVSCHALDIGSMSPLFWAFEEREVIMGFYESISGARMHANYYKPNQHFFELNVALLDNITQFTTLCYKTIQELACVLTHNKIWKQRLVNIGAYGLTMAQEYGLSGVMSRCVGIKRDVRINNPYAAYPFLKFTSFVGNNGDCFDRFVLRILEMGESLNIATQCCNWLYKNMDARRLTPKKNKKASMETVIHDFKIWQLGYTFDDALTFSTVESPKGEFGVMLYSNTKSNKPTRCKIRSSSLQHLNLLNTIALNHSLADLVTLVGTIDIVFGEIDR